MKPWVTRVNVTVYSKVVGEDRSSVKTSHTHRGNYVEVMDMLISFIVVVITHCICIPSYTL